MNTNDSSNSTLTPTPTPPKRGGFAPVLLIFLALPILGLVAAILVISGQQSGASATPAPASTPAPVTLPTSINLVDAPMIDFTLPTFDGGTVSLSNLHGRVVFLNFWATWCDPCKRELPAMMEFQAAHPRSTDPIILAVNYGDSMEQIRSFLDANAINGLNIALDSDMSIADQYGVFQLPVTFVIDQNGIVRYPKYGEMTVDDLNGYVQALGG